MAVNLLVLIQTKSQIRTFLETQSFCKFEISSKYEISYLISDNLNLKDDYSNLNLVYIPTIPKIFRVLGSYLASALLWKNRFRSMAHLRRANASFSRTKIRRVSEYHSYVAAINISFFQRSIVKVLSILPFLRFVSRLRTFVVNIFIKRNLSSRGINSKKYQYVIIPFSGLLNSDFDDYVNYFNLHKVFTIAIQENWDHLSSKTFISSDPRHFCVWGMQSFGHLQIVHLFDPSKITVIGSPRMLPYLDPDEKSNLIKRKTNRSNFDLRSRYVLFCGSGDGRDDYFILNSLVQTVKNYPSLQVFYRPHPNSRHNISWDKIDFLKSNGLVIDDSKNVNSVYFHCDLVLNCELLVTPFSTMLVEGLMCNKKVLLPGFSSIKLNYDFSNAVDTWLHFIGIRCFPNIFISATQEDFVNKINDALLARIEHSRSSAAWICAAVNFEEKIFELIDSDLNLN